MKLFGSDKVMNGHGITIWVLWQDRNGTCARERSTVMTKKRSGELGRFDIPIVPLGEFLKYPDISLGL